MWRGVTAVNTLRDYWTFIVSLRKYDIFLKLTLPQYIISAILSFRKLLPENPRIHADSRNSKNFQGFVNALDILGSS